MTVLGTVLPAVPGAGLALVLPPAVAAAWAWWRTRPQLAGTTLVTPWNWLGGCLLLAVLALCYLAGSGVDDRAVLPLWYAVAAGTVCPSMSVLGAKRPQDRGWNLVVVALWVVVALPAAEALALGRGLELSGLRSWFVPALILLGIFNTCLGRQACSGWLFAVGQLLMFAPYWPLIRLPDNGWAPAVGTALCLLAAIWTSAILARRSRAEFGWTRVWLDFRDGFGTLWGLRIMERLNADAEVGRWPLRLQWSGWVACEPLEDLADLSPDTLDKLELSLNNLLRRFVTPEWILERLRPPHTHSGDLS